MDIPGISSWENFEIALGKSLHFLAITAYRSDIFKMLN